MLLLNFLKNQTTIVSVFLSILVLTSCGGGGSGGNAISNAINVAETIAGIYTGVSDGGITSYFASVGDGLTYSIDVSAETMTNAALASAPTVASNTFTATGANIINFGSQSSTSSSISGTVSSSSAISTTNQTTGKLVNYTLNSNFNTTASYSAIAGNYTGWGITKTTAAQSYTVAINNTGGFAESIPGCSLSGNFS